MIHLFRIKIYFQKYYQIFIIDCAAAIMNYFRLIRADLFFLYGIKLAEYFYVKECMLQYLYVGVLDINIVTYLYLYRASHVRARSILILFRCHAMRVLFTFTPASQCIFSLKCIVHVW